MLKKLSIGLLCAGVFCSAHAYKAMPLTKDYVLKPNIVTTIKNYWPTTLTAHCTIALEDRVPATVQFTVTHKEGSINDNPLPEGSVFYLQIENGATFNITAARGASVDILNHGNKDVTASCSL